MPSPKGQPPTFHTLYTYLLTTYPPPLLPPPPHPHEPSLSHAISSLQLHPTLEAALHILNADLPSAHFLVRHMQAPPALEGMYLHGILHRVEGDYDNARAWYADVSRGESGSGALREVWGAEDEGWRGFLGRVEALNAGKGRKGEGWEREKRALERESRREVEGVVRFCCDKFGTGRWEDVSAEWVRPGDEHRRMGQDMVSGGKGWRDF